MRHLRLSGIRKHLLFLAVLAAYLLSASQLYQWIFIHHGRPEAENIALPEAGQAVTVKLSDLRASRVDGQDVYELRGFAFLTDAPQVEHRIRVVLQSETGNLVFATEPAISPAMIDSSTYSNLGVEHSEFRAVITKYGVPEGRYQVGVLLDQPAGGGQAEGAAIYTLSGAKVRRTANHLRYTRAPDPPE